jgi:hypothetical protein
LARYRALANELAVQRQSGGGSSEQCKSGQRKPGQSGGPRQQAGGEGAAADCLASGSNDATPPLDHPAPSTRAARAILAVGTILAGGLALASTASWFQFEGGDVKAAETTNAQGLQPAWQPAASDIARSDSTNPAFAPSDSAPPDPAPSGAALSGAAPSASGAARTDATGVSELPSPLESVLIASTAQAEALADLRLRLQQAQALSDSYAARLAEEQAHSLILEEALAERQVDASPPVPSPVSSMAPSPAQAPSREEPDQPTAETQATADPVQPAAEQPQPVAALLPPAAEQGQSATPALQPTAAMWTPPVLSAAILDRLMLRARQLREQGDIAAARLVLESGADSGYGPALFQLAETYDPDALSVWRTFGTKGDVAKARELYLRAEEAGVAEATERLKSLPR